MGVVDTHGLFMMHKMKDNTSSVLIVGQLLRFFKNLVSRNTGNASTCLYETLARIGLLDAIEGVTLRFLSSKDKLVGRLVHLGLVRLMYACIVRKILDKDDLPNKMLIICCQVMAQMHSNKAVILRIMHLVQRVVQMGQNKKLWVHTWIVHDVLVRALSIKTQFTELRRKTLELVFTAMLTFGGRCFCQVLDASVCEHCLWYCIRAVHYDENTKYDHKVSSLVGKILNTIIKSYGHVKSSIGLSHRSILCVGIGIDAQFHKQNESIGHNIYAIYNIL